MQLLHQLEVQRRGGPCARYPSSCVVRDLLQPVFQPFKPLRVLDLTFGEGIFYYAIRPRVHVTGFDIRKNNWVVKPHVFYQESAEKWRTRVQHQDFDVVVVDPPWAGWKRGTRKHYEDNGSIGLLLREAKRAAEHFNAYLLIHFIWKAVPYGFEIVKEAWFQGRSIYIKEPEPSWFGLLKKVY